MLINIEELTMEEYEILVRGGNSPGKGRLSVMEITKEEYDEMIWRRNGSKLDRLSLPIGNLQGSSEFYADEEDFTDEDEDEDREWEELGMWLTNKIDENSKFTPFPEEKVYLEETINEKSSPTTSLPKIFPNHVQESGNFVNLNSCYFTNEFVEFQEEIIDEAWFDAILMDEDMGSRINQVEQIIYSLEDFDSTKELKELEDLLDDPEMILLDETNGNAREISEPPYSLITLEKKDTHESRFAKLQDVCATPFNPKPRTKTRDEAAENPKEILNSDHIRRMPIIGHTPYAPANTYTPYVNSETYGVYNHCLEKWILKVDLFLRETREWNDARVKLHKVLVKSDEALVLDESLKEN